MLKWQFLELYNPCSCFDVKSEWQEISEISTLWSAIYQSAIFRFFSRNLVKYVTASGVPCLNLIGHYFWSSKIWKKASFSSTPIAGIELGPPGWQFTALTTRLSRQLKKNGKIERLYI